MRPVVPVIIQEELQSVVDWYENRETGLGDRFVQEYERCLGLISERPDAFGFEPYTRGDEEVRYLALRRFPYRLIYTVRGDFILLVAVAHASRRPGYGRRRLNEIEEE